MAKKLTRTTVANMEPGDQTAAYFKDAEEPGTRASKGPRMNLKAQQNFHNDPWGAVQNWIATLPRW